MNAGELAPDSIMIELLEKRLREPDCLNGFILDGFPRTLSQANYLKTLVECLKTPLDAVISIEVASEVIVDRLTRRGRYDDTPTTIKHRLDIYHRETEPLKEFYRQIGMLRGVDGDADQEEVTGRILRCIAAIDF